MPRHRSKPQRPRLEIPARRGNLETKSSIIAEDEISIPPLELDDEAYAIIMERPGGAVRHFLDLVSKAEQRGVTPEEFAELLCNPNMTAAMVESVVEWSCGHYESGLDELNALLDTLSVVDDLEVREMDEVRDGYTGYRNPYRESPELSCLEVAIINIQGSWSRDEDVIEARKRAVNLLCDRGRYGATLEYIVRVVFGVSVACADRIYKSSEPYAVSVLASHGPDNPLPPLAPQSPPWPAVR